MAPLMTLKEDDMVEAILLRSIGEEAGPSPTPEEEAVLLGNENVLGE